MFATSAMPSTRKRAPARASMHGGSFSPASQPTGAAIRSRPRDLQANMSAERSPSPEADAPPPAEQAPGSRPRAFGGSERIPAAQVRDGPLTHRNKRVRDLIRACVHLDQDAAKRVLAWSAADLRASIPPATLAALHTLALGSHPFTAQMHFNAKYNTAMDSLKEELALVTASVEQLQKNGTDQEETCEHVARGLHGLSRTVDGLGLAVGQHASAYAQLSKQLQLQSRDHGNTLSTHRQQLDLLQAATQNQLDREDRAALSKQVEQLTVALTAALVQLSQLAQLSQQEPSRKRSRSRSPAQQRSATPQQQASHQGGGVYSLSGGAPMPGQETRHFPPLAAAARAPRAVTAHPPPVLASPSPEPCDPKIARIIEELAILKANADREVGLPYSSRGLPSLPKPAPFSGATKEVVEDKLFAFETYLSGSGIPRPLWCSHIMSLLTEKALTAWTSVAMPAAQAGITLTWDLFTTCMLKSFAHPDREFQARDQLHHIKQGPTQSATDYSRHFNSLVQKCGTPTPALTDLIMFFHAGLAPSLQAKTSTNPANGKFWTDLDAFQRFVISTSTHSTPATPTPRLNLGSASRRTDGRRYPRVAVAFASTQGSKPKHQGKNNNKGKGGRGEGGPGPASAAYNRERAEAGSVEEARRISVAMDRKAAEAKKDLANRSAAENEKRKREKKN